MNITEITRKLVSGETLQPHEADTAARLLAEGEATPVTIASFLTAQAGRGETLDLVVAFAREFRDRVAPFRAPEGLIFDTCGTGGDHSGTFNISTAAAFVLAGAGVTVAKHGNRSMTSQCGSADVFESLGVQIDGPAEVMERALAETGLCFLFAPLYHSAMRHVGPVRKELGFRTVFNVLGPLLNPARANRQVVGVFRRDYLPLIAEALGRLGSQRALVVHGDDGLDEITLSADTHVCEWRDGKLIESVWSPEQAGLARADRLTLAGGSADENARIIEAVLRGVAGPCLDVVLLNAGAALYIADKAPDLPGGVALARETVASGAAYSKLEQLRAIAPRST